MSALDTVPCGCCGIAGGVHYVAPDGILRHPPTECAELLRNEVLRLRALVERYEAIDRATATATEVR